MEDPGASSFWKIAALGLLVIWNTFFKVEIAAVDCFWQRTEGKSEETIGLSQEKHKIFLSIPKFSKYLNIYKYS